MSRHPNQRARGERQGSAKLTAAAVLEIRRRYSAERASQRQLAREFGVSKAAVAAVIKGHTWTHIAATAKPPDGEKPRRAAQKGEANPKAKLTERDIRTIRDLLLVRKGTEIARMFAVSSTTIYRVANGTGWKHV